MEYRDKMERELRDGNKYPYDTLLTEEEAIYAADCWHFRAARGVLHELSGRGGIDHSLKSVDAELRLEIVENLATIILLARNAYFENPDHGPE